MPTMAAHTFATQLRADFLVHQYCMADRCRMAGTGSGRQCVAEYIQSHADQRTFDAHRHCPNHGDALFNRGSDLSSQDFARAPGPAKAPAGNPPHQAWHTGARVRTLPARDWRRTSRSIITADAVSDPCDGHRVTDPAREPPAKHRGNQPALGRAAPRITLDRHARIAHNSAPPRNRWPAEHQPTLPRRTNHR